VPPEISAAFSDRTWDELCAALERHEESAAVLLAGIADTSDRLIFTINRAIWVPDNHYIERTHNRLKIASRGWMPALKAAAAEGLHPVFFHTHPSGNASPSALDDAVDSALAQPFRTRAGVDTYSSMILGGDPDAPSFSGRAYRGGDTVPIGHARIVGRQLRFVHNTAHDGAEASTEIHDRQVLAFGQAGQDILASLKIGVVGAGGTGSAVIEQLTRLGVRRLVVVDDDFLTSSNVSRVYGSSIRQAGEAKVQIAAQNAERIGLGTQLTAIAGRVTRRLPLENLRDCDVIFGCTDDHAGRINLSRLSFQYLIPLIDLGVVIDSDGSNIRSITGRITYVSPGEPCLVCRGTVDVGLARDEGLDPRERTRLAEEGYARGLEEPDPSVIAYTTLVAASGVADFLERLFGFGAPHISGEMVIRIADRKVKGRSGSPEDGHFCGDAAAWGLGDQTPFLGQAVWPE
jgi:ThiF family/Prokaryotic homologs of the JAB domain